MDELCVLNKYTNIVLLNLVFVWILFAIYKKQNIKIGQIETSIGLFYLVLLLDNWITHLTSWNEFWYYTATAGVFLPFSFYPKAKLATKIASFIGFAALLYLINSEILIQITYLVSIIVILAQAKNYFLQSSKLRYIGIVLSLIALFEFFIAQQFTFMKLDGNWGQSKYLIYFSICDYIVFTTMLLVIHANFRRLFFN